MITGFMIVISCAIGSHEAKPKTGLDVDYKSKAECEVDAAKKDMAEFNLKFTGDCHPVCTEIVEGEQ